MAPFSAILEKNTMKTPEVIFDIPLRAMAFFVAYVADETKPRYSPSAN